MKVIRKKGLDGLYKNNMKLEIDMWLEIRSCDSRVSVFEVNIIKIHLIYIHEISENLIKYIHFNNNNEQED